jgi:outer membrane protein assembly factor BamD (BamD/ComL family)
LSLFLAFALLMGGGAMRRLTLVVALMTLSACSAASSTRLTSSIEAERLAREANAQIEEGNPSAAVPILEDVVRRFPDAPIHDQALYNLARALVLTASGGREYRQAAAHLDRLLRDYPTSPYAADARALRIALGAYVARTAELDRLLERLKAIDLEFEHPRQP